MLLAHEPEVTRRGDSQTRDDAPSVGRRALSEPLGSDHASPQSAAGATGAAMPVDHDQRTIAAIAGSDTMARSPLPHYDTIQRSFGRHDVSAIHAYAGGSAAAHSIGASAYATGSHVAMGGAPPVHTVAHEAAHVVQQGPRGPAEVAGPAGATGAVDPANA